MEKPETTLLSLSSSRRALLGKVGLAGVLMNTGAQPLRAAGLGDDPNHQHRELNAVPTVALSPQNPLIAQYVSATTFLSSAECRIERAAWDWGDGTPSDSGLTSSHYYMAPGVYTVTLSIFEGGKSSSASKTVEVPATSPPPPTLPLLRRYRSQLFGVPPPFHSEVVNLVEMASKQISRANSLAGGSDPEQFLAAGLYVAAGELSIAANELVTGLTLAGKIRLDQFGSLVLDGLVPVLVSLSRDLNALNPSVLAELAPVGGCGWFWRRGCDIGLIAAAAAFGAIAGVVTAGCVELGAIPYIGPVLTILCAIGVGITLALVVQLLTQWHEGWYAGHSTS